MDDANWARTTRSSLARARAEARQAGSRTLEAEHLMLALASDAGSEPARLLAEAGLDYERLADALRNERRQSLAYAGLEPVAENPMARARSEDTMRPAPIEGTPGWATSAKEALLRSRSAATRGHRTRLNGIDLLVGILRADLGTVPRALELAGIDRATLIERAQA